MWWRCTPSRPAAPAGARRNAPPPSMPRAEALGIEVRHPASLKGEAEQASLRRAGCRCRGGRGLWPDTAASRARRAETRLPQCPRLAAAALARRCADPPRDSGRGRGDRHHHHADGGRPRYRADAVETRARLSMARRPANCTTNWRSMGASADGGGCWRTSIRCKPSRRMTRWPPTPPRSTRRRREMDFTRPAECWNAKCAPLRLSPAAGSNWMESGSSCCAPKWPTAKGLPAKCWMTVHDHRLRRQARCARSPSNAQASPRWRWMISCAAIAIAAGTVVA